MRYTVRRFWKYIREYKATFLIAIIGTIMTASGTAAVPYLIQPVMDEIFIKQDKEMLYLLPFAVIIAYFLKGFGEFIQAYFTNYIGQDIIRKIRDDLLSRLVGMELAFFQTSQKGSLMSRITSDTARVQSIVSNAIPVLIRDSLTMVALLAVVIYQSPKLAFFGLVILPAAAYPLSLLAKRMKRLSKTSQHKIANMTSRLSEIFQNIEIIKAYSAEDFETKRFEKDNREFFRYTMKTVKTNLLTSPLMELLGAVGVAVVIVVGGLEVIDGNLSVGAFFSFMTALFMLYAPVKSVSRLYNSLQDAVAAGERIFEFLDLKSSITDGKEELKKAIDQVELKNARVEFGSTVALKGVNLKATKGETIALVGMSGGGKSTLVNLLSRLIDTTSGEVLISGENIKNYTLNSLRDQIAVVSQQVFLFNDTVAANVAYGKDVDRDLVIKALKDANAWEFVKKLDGGIDTVLEEGGAGLSGGQKQRLSIARAIYKNPSLYILDEATSALDNESEAKVQEALKNATKDKITFVIAHRLSTIKDATKIALLIRGEIVDMGDEEYMLANSKEYQKLKNLSCEL